MSIPVCRAVVFLKGLWQCLSEQKWRAWFQSQVSLVCLFVIYSDHWRYQGINSPVNTDKNPDLAHTMPVSSINKLKIFCPTYLFSFWPSVRQWWKADSLTPSFEFRYLCFIRLTGLVCKNVISCPCSSGSYDFPICQWYKTEFLRIQSGWWWLVEDLQEQF